MHQSRTRRPAVVVRSEKYNREQRCHEAGGVALHSLGEQRQEAEDTFGLAPREK